MQLRPGSTPEYPDSLSQVHQNEPIIHHQALEFGSRLRCHAICLRGDPEVQLPQQINDVLHILHEAQSLPPAEAIEALRPFINTMRNRTFSADRLADASAAAVSALVQRLESKGVATDDLWEEAIESSLSFANEAS